VRNLLRIGLGLLLANNAAAFAQQYVISTIAGRGAPLFQPSALSAAISPNSVAVDTAGNVYLSSLNAVYRLDSSGALTRIAGGYGAGCAGDGGPAINAQLNGPWAIAVDAAGAVYIADVGNKRIRKVSPNGVITTFAGDNNPECGPSGVPTVYAQLVSLVGVAVDAAGAVYIADSSNGANGSVKKVSGGVVTTLIDKVGGLFGMAADTAGNVYIAGWGMTKVATNGVVSTVLVSNLVATSPAVDTAGNVYFADDMTVKKVTPHGVVTTLVGAGSCNPSGVAIDAAGNLYIADDSSNDRILKRSPDGVLSTVAGAGWFGSGGDGGPATDAQFGQASGVALDATGALYVADSYKGRVRKISPDGTITTVAGGGAAPYSAPNGDGGQATDAVVSVPTGVAVDSLGNLYITEGFDIRKVGLDGVISTFQTIAATNLAFGPDGSLYVSATTVNEILPTGAVVPVAGNGYVYQYCYPFEERPCPPPPPPPPPLGDGGPATQATITPTGITVDSASNVYIADKQGRIREVFSSTGVISTIIGASVPTAVALDAAGNLYIADAGHLQIYKLSTDGTVTAIAGNGSQGHSGDGGLALNSQLSGPTGLAVDADGNVYVSDTDSIRLLKPVTATIPASTHLPARNETQPR
jgi:sugar lactone lactonase YvrE